MLNNWQPRAGVGFYLGSSPMHGRNLALVLNRATGLVSAQFDEACDVLFDTLDKVKKHEQSWLLLAGFTQLKYL